jgi:ankyrin repeat protein
MDDPEEPAQPRLDPEPLPAAIDRFLRAACGPDAYHRPQVAEAERRLAARPEITRASAHAAAAAGDVEALRARSDVLEPGGPMRATPIVYACFSCLAATARRQGLLAAVRLLLDRGADPNAAWVPPELSDNPLSALYGAVGWLNDPELADALLSAGAHPDDGESLYHSTEHRGDHRCLELLVAYGARFPGTNALLRMLDFEDLKGLRLCLDAGAPVDEPAAPGSPPRSALHHAILRGRGVDTVRELIGRGARLDVRDAAGRTPLMMARRLGQTATADLLATSGAPADVLSAKDEFLAAAAAGNRDRATALAAATPGLVAGLGAEDLRLLPDLASLGRHDAVELLIDLGFPVAVKGDWDASALNQAAFRGDTRMVALLLAHGARWDERNGFGGDAFGSAIWPYLHDRAPGADYLGVIRLLLESGGEPPDDEISDPDLLQLLAPWQDQRQRQDHGQRQEHEQ